MRPAMSQLLSLLKSTFPELALWFEDFPLSGSRSLVEALPY